MGNAEYEQLLGKARDAKVGGIDAWSVQSTGEKVCVAMVLNKPEWLAKMDYTIPEAIDRAGSWLPLIPKVAKVLRDEDLD